MKIIKEGKPKEELKSILNKTRRFECGTCGCIFEADEDEYQYEEDYIYSAYYCKCPNCKISNAHEVKMREIDKKAEESTYKDVEPKGKPKVCYDIGCINHIGVDSCKLAFPPGTSFDKMLTCPYRMPAPLANIGYDFGEGSK
jgi:hypothetical protein